MRKKLINLLFKLRLTFLLKPVYWLWNCKFCIQKNNSIIFNKAVLIKCRFKVIGTNNIIEIKDDVFLEHSNINIHGNNNKITIEPGAYANALNIIIENNNNEIYIHKNFFVFGNTRLYVVDGSKLTFGNDCMLSDNIEIRTTDNHAIYDLNTNERINPEGDINIGEHVWIGMGATILKGVSVANGCIIGAKAIVTKSVEEPNCCVVDTNKIVKRNVRWTMSR